jgi:hypothetical protein
VEIWPLEAVRDACSAISPAAPASGPDAPAVSPAGPDASLARRADSTTSRKPLQTSSSAAPPEWPGLPLDGPARGPVRPNQGSFWQAFPPSFFLCMKTPSPVNLTLYAYISNISSHKT